jgi:hypothetical protein
MMLYKITVIALMTILIYCSAALAVGEAAAPSLIISPSARAWGLGQSYCAIADDATAIYWNPGGLGFLEGTHISLTHSQLVPMLAPDVYFESISASHLVRGVGTLGLNLTYLTYGKWWETTTGGVPVAEHSSYEFSIGGYYATKLTEKAALGLGLKLAHVYLAPATEQTGFKEGAGWSFAADFGLLYKVHPRFSAGITLQNLGPDMSFIEKEDSAPLPRTLRLGIAAWPLVGESYSSLVSLEATKALIGLDEIFTEGKFSEVSRDATLNGGVEVMFANFVAPRIGYIYDPDGKIKGVTFGFGIYINLSGARLAFDYAGVPKAEDLGRENKFSLGVEL